MESVGVVAIPEGVGTAFNSPPRLLIGENGLFRVGSREYNSIPCADDNFGRLIGVLISPRREVILLGTQRCPTYPDSPLVEKRNMGPVSKEECHDILSDLSRLAN